MSASEVKPRMRNKMKIKQLRGGKALHTDDANRTHAGQPLIDTTNDELCDAAATQREAGR